MMSMLPWFGIERSALGVRRFLQVFFNVQLRTSKKL
jgi:hypothetical protein